MAFLERIGFVETPEQERDRLAQAPEGSTTHSLSLLPVTITEWPQDLLVELPWEPPRTAQPYRIVVVPTQFHPEYHPAGEEQPLPHKRHSGSWTCSVVASDHPSYPVGGHRIDISAAEIARGRKLDLLALLAGIPA